MRSFLILWVQMDFFCPDGTLCADFSFLDGNFAGLYPAFWANPTESAFAPPRLLELRCETALR